MSKNCIACGMPMKKNDDFAQDNPNLTYCKHCAKPDGSMQNYNEKLESMSNFMVQSQGMDKNAAIEVAKTIMHKLPAWKSMA